MTRRTAAVDQDKGSLEVLARSALLEAVEGATTLPTNADPTLALNDDDGGVPDALLQLFSSGNDRQKLGEGLAVRDQKQLLFKSIQTMPRATARRFFSALYGHVNTVIQRESFLPDSAYPDDDDIREDDGSLIEVTPDAASSAAMQFLRCATQCTQAYVDATIASKRHKDDPSARSVPIHVKIPVIDEVFQIAKALHDVLIPLNSAGPDGPATQAAIVALCETWWTNNVESREAVILQVLPILAHLIINEDTKSTLKRFYQLREAIRLVEIDCPDSHVFKTGLLHLASSPKVLKFPEGKKLLAYLLQLDHAILRGLHKAIRVQIPGLGRPLLMAVGECYFRAWKDASSLESREAIESVALQDLMHIAVHTAMPNLLKSLLIVLDPFHSERKNPEVEKMLFRMYSGMIWRSLSTANGKIRVNATHVFAQVFPLRDASAAQTENALRKATDALETLLQDPDPNVRVAAAQAVAKIMPTYWDLLPPQEIREILNLIVLEHASDRSSSSVRSAAVDAISCVLDAPQSHGVLRPLLPLMGNLIHDRVEKVRMSVVRLLLKVKNTRGIKYYHVVPVEHLIGRLEAEASMDSRGPVARCLTGLMVNSFCPHGAQAQSHDQVNRAIKLVTEHPVAAMVFYTNLSRHVPSRTVESLVSNLFQCLLVVVRGTNSEGSNGNSEEIISATDGPLSKAMDVVVMTNLIETIAAMMQSMKLMASDSAKSTEPSQVLDMPTLLDLLKFFEHYEPMNGADGDADISDVQIVLARGITALLSCARNQPADSIHDLVEHAKQVLSLRSDQESFNVTPYLSLLCSLGSTDEVASSLASSIASSFEREFTLNFASPEAGSRKRKTSKGGKKNVALPIPMLAPKVALAALGSILKGEDSGGTTARASFFASASAIDVLEGALVRGTKHAEHLLRGISRGSAFVGEDIEYVLDVCETFGRFILHKDAFASGAGQVTDSNFKELLQWMTDAVLPILATSSGTDNLPFIDPDLSRISMEKSFDGRVSSPMPSGPPRRRSNRNSTPVRLDANESSFTGLGTLQPVHHVSEISRAVAISLLHSNLILLAERVAIEPSEVGVVERAALQWLSAANSDDDLSMLDKLRTAFSQLAFSLCKYSSSFTILVNVMTKLGEWDDDGDRDVSEVILKLLSNRTLISSTAVSILDAAHLLLDEEESTNLGLPGGFNDLLASERGCVRSALKVAFASKAACFELANRCIVALDKQEHVESIQLFHAKLLFLLCDENHSKFAAEIGEKVRGFVVGITGAPTCVLHILNAIDLRAQQDAA